MQINLFCAPLNHPPTTNLYPDYVHSVGICVSAHLDKNETSLAMKQSRSVLARFNQMNHAVHILDLHMVNGFNEGFNLFQTEAETWQE